MSDFYASEENFRRFEDVIFASIKAPDKKIEVFIAGLAPTTICARLRDAIGAFKRNDWTSNINKEAFYTWNNIKIVRLVDGIVYLQQKDIRTITPLAKAVAKSESVKEELRLDQPSIEELKAVCILLSNRRLSGVRLTRTSDIDIPTIITDYDVECVQEGDSFVLI